ncbi:MULTISPECIES: hypothetical protein [Nocardia]|nr:MULTISPECIES: hypothetical protein [Nocardia]
MRFGVVGAVELGDGGQGGRFFGVEVVVGAAEGFGEGIVRVAVLSLLQD